MTIEKSKTEDKKTSNYSDFHFKILWPLALIGAVSGLVGGVAFDDPGAGMLIFSFFTGGFIVSSLASLYFEYVNMKTLEAEKAIQANFESKIEAIDKESPTI